MPSPESNRRRSRSGWRQRSRPGDARTGPAHPALAYEPPRSLAALRIAGWLASLVAVIVLVYAGYWFFAARQLREATLAWAVVREAQGDEVRLGDPTLAGFPGTIRLEVERPRARTALPGGSFAWQADHAAITMNPLTPGQVVVGTSGRQDVAVDTGAAARHYRGTVERLDMPIVIKSGAVQEIALDLAVLRLSAGPGDDLAVAELRGRLIALDGAAMGHSAATGMLQLDAAGVNLPAVLGLPLGQEVGRLSLAAELRERLPAGPLTPALAAWRDAGGTVEILHLLGDYGPLSLDASGTLSLDKAMQPIGAMSGQVGGLFETIDRLRDGGQVRSRDATTAKLVLATLARRDASTGRSVLDVPLTLQDRILSVGPVRVLEVPPVVWPGTSPPAAGSGAGP